MSILPETLRAYRNKVGLSQQGLADRTEQVRGGKVSKRTISRIENGETPSEKVRRHTLESLAKALNVKPDALCKAPDEHDESWLEERGYTIIKVFLSPDIRLNYRCVLHHYGIEFHELVDAAPWMFTLLAEMSLADRRSRLQSADAAFKQAMDQLPVHLAHGYAARNDFDEASSDEENSIASRDIFGNKVLETESMGPDPFDPNYTNPFVGFLRKAAHSTGSKEIDAADIELPYGGGMPSWPVFQMWLEDLTGGDRLARFAVENVKVELASMPAELKHEDKVDERVAWLINKIPPEMREREEKRLADWDALKSKIKL